LKRLARRDLPTTPRVPRPTVNPSPRVFASQPSWPTITIGAAIGWTLAGLKWIIVLAVLGAIAGFGYSTLAKPKFTAYTDLVVDPANLQLLSNDLYSNAFEQQAQLLDAESKLRVLTSGNVLTRVVTELNLQADPEFVGSSGPIDLSFLFGTAAGNGDPVLTAVDALSKKVAARREERSYVVTLGVSTETADKSVLIANALVAAFQAELAQAEADGASRAADALVQRLSELKAEVTTAEGAVATFRQEHGLEASNSGELVNTQSMTLLNQRAIEAQQALIAAQSRYTEMTDPVTGRANADAVQTPTMVALRTQYGLLKQQADAAATMYGPLHPTRASAERQLGGLQQQISAEAARAVQTAKLELDQARSTVAELEVQTGAARNTVAMDGQAQVQLRDLERDAKAKADVYQAFLTRAREITERQQIDTTNIRIISPATPPATRSWPPRAVVTLGAGGAGGAALGIALALGFGFLAAARQLRTRPTRGEAHA
jgi:uncharacterized protein involved in exopolysaccharide biosynthesis